MKLKMKSQSIFNPILEKARDKVRDAPVDWLRY